MLTTALPVSLTSTRILAIRVTREISRCYTCILNNKPHTILREGSGNVIALPVLTETSSLSVAPPDFVRVLEAPGMVHIERRIMRSILIELIGTIWPMMIGVLLSAGFAGVVIWLLVSAAKFHH